MRTFESSKIKWGFLAAGMLGLLLSGPAFGVGIGGWMYPLGLLFFLRHSKVLAGYLWMVLFMFITSVIAGVLTSPLPLMLIVATTAIVSFIKVLPFLVDRLIYKKLSPKLSHLAFPVIGVTYEYLMSPMFGTVSSLASTQTGFSTFIQLASVTGVFGVSFLMYWFASIVVSAIESKSVRTTYAFTAVFALVVIFGFIKKASTNQAGDTVKVSGISIEMYSFWEGVYQDLFGEEIEMDIYFANSSEQGRLMTAFPEMLADPDKSKYTHTNKGIKDLTDQLLEYTISEAGNGAKIIVWSETNLPVYEEDLEEIIQRASMVAKEYNVSVLMSTAILLPYKEGNPLYKNQSIFITPDGRVADEFEKARPVPFMDGSAPGDGVMEIVDTDFGRITNAVCYDGDFPDLISQSGDADILLLPSRDWLEISPFHGDISSLRAIENGVSIVRPTGTGQSVIFDYHGQAVARINAFDKEVRIVNGYVPVHGIQTVYNRLGNYFVWLCIPALLVFIFLSFSVKKKSM